MFPLLYMWYVYILRCSDNTLYTGITLDVKRRVKEHNEAKRGSKYTISRLPVKLVYKETHLHRSSALRREAQIKHLTKEKKEALVLCNKNK